MNEPDAPDNPSAEDLSELYRSAPRPQPPLALSDEIRQAARAAVAAPQRRVLGTWRQGIAVAAVVVLSATVVLLLPRDQLFGPEEAARVPQTPIESSSPAPAKSLPSVAAPPAPEPKREQAGRSREAAPQPPTPGALRLAPADQPGAAPDADEALDLRRDAAASGGTVAEEAEQTGAGAPARQNAGQLEQSYYRSSPELWISHIERLLSEGRFAEAKREFDDFRTAHPQHPYAER